MIGAPDGKVLYVPDIRAGKTFSYAVQSDGTLTDKKLCCNLGSDGMTIDSDGNIHTISHGALQVFDKAGKQIDQILVSPANCCFGGPDGHLLFFTAPTEVYGLLMRTPSGGTAVTYRSTLPS